MSSVQRYIGISEGLKFNLVKPFLSGQKQEFKATRGSMLCLVKGDMVIVFDFSRVRRDHSGELVFEGLTLIGSLSGEDASKMVTQILKDTQNN